MSSDDRFDDVDLGYFNKLFPGLGSEQQSRYYDFDSFNSLNSSSSLSVFHYNIHSHLPKLDEFTG